MTKSSLFFLYQSRRIEEFTVELGRANLDIVLSLFFRKLNADFAASRGFLMELIYLGRRVPLHYMVPRFQGCILPDTTPPKRLKPNRIVVRMIHSKAPPLQLLSFQAGWQGFIRLEEGKFGDSRDSRVPYFQHPKFLPRFHGPRDPYCESPKMPKMQRFR